MKTKLTPVVAIIALTMALSSTAFAKGKEVTITGEGQCAKCALHEAKSCQNTITVEEQGKKITYYLAQNKVSKGVPPKHLQIAGKSDGHRRGQRGAWQDGNHANQNRTREMRWGVPGRPSRRPFPSLNKNKHEN